MKPYLRNGSFDDGPITLIFMEVRAQTRPSYRIPLHVFGDAY